MKTTYENFRNKTEEMTIYSKTNPDEYRMVLKNTANIVNILQQTPVEYNMKKCLN